ncbi:hypothetical protein McanCB56680_002188 [Microsporum canis]
MSGERGCFDDNDKSQASPSKSFDGASSPQEIRILPAVIGILKGAKFRAHVVEDFGPRVVMGEALWNNPSVDYDRKQPSRHSRRYLEQSIDHPEIYAHMPPGPYKDVEEFEAKYIQGTVYSDKTKTVFAIIDRTKAGLEEDGGALAGIVSYTNASVANQLLEIAFLVVLPAFQRTHVTTHAVGLLLQYALDAPDCNDPQKGGLGLRKVLWQTGTTNAASRATAKKMGFEQEGILRWDRVYYDAVPMKKESNGRRMPEHGDERHLGRDTVFFGLCWDEWHDGKKQMVQQRMEHFLQ